MAALIFRFDMYVSQCEKPIRSGNDFWSYLTMLLGSVLTLPAGTAARQLPPRQNSPSPRPAPGSVPYGGVGIHGCTVAGTGAVTYDDGPSAYTAELLDKLAVQARGRPFSWWGTTAIGAW